MRLWAILWYETVAVLTWPVNTFGRFLNIFFSFHTNLTPRRVGVRSRGSSASIKIIIVASRALLLYACIPIIKAFRPCNLKHFHINARPITYTTDASRVFFSTAPLWWIIEQYTARILYTRTYTYWRTCELHVHEVQCRCTILLVHIYTCRQIELLLTCRGAHSMYLCMCVWNNEPISSPSYRYVYMYM